MRCTVCAFGLLFTHVGCCRGFFFFFQNEAALIKMRLDRGRLKLLLGEDATELRDLHWFSCTAEAEAASQLSLNKPPS